MAHSKKEREVVLLNQTAIFFPPVVAPLVAFACAKWLQVGLNSYLRDPVEVRLEARVLAPALWSDHSQGHGVMRNVYETCVNLLKVSIFPSLWMKLLNRFGAQISSFDIPDCHSFEDSLGTISPHRSLVRALAWALVSAENSADQWSSVRRAIEVSSCDVVDLHLSSYELVKLAEANGGVWWRELEGLATSLRKRVNIGVDN